MNAMDQLRAIVREHELRDHFSPEAQAEALAWEQSSGIDDPGLVDLTHLPMVTIDDETSRDLDQALYVEDDVIWYALADASYYVPVGSALWEESLARGATYYLPGFAIPMLPRTLSEGIVSLNPDVDRRALVMKMTLDDDCRCVGTEMIRARVRSHGKLSFESVQAFLDGGPSPCEAASESLRALKRFGERRIQLAEERDRVRYRRDELSVKMGPEKMHFVATAGSRNDVDRYNEQISLLCNSEGMRFLDEGDRPDDHVQPVYRIHDPPRTERVETFEAQVDTIAEQHGEVYRWDREISLATYLDELPEGPVARAIHRQAIMTNQASVFSDEPGEHHGVGVELYGRFSSPMREVVGIWLHKELFEKIAGHGREGDEGLVPRIIEVSNEARKLQKQLDREANRLVLDQLFEAAGEERFEATVMGITATKVHLQLAGPGIDVKAYLRDLPGSWGGDEVGASVHQDGEPVFWLGDTVDVVVRGHDAGRDRWVLGVYARP